MRLRDLLDLARPAGRQGDNSRSRPGGGRAPRRRQSLRSHLALTYAGIALLTAVILGAILLAVLGNYYTRAESSYLRASARLVAADPPPLTTQDELGRWALAVALTTQTRVRVYDGAGALLADSGSPRDLDSAALLRGPGGGQHRMGRLPEPFGEGLFGSGGGRSDRVLTVMLRGSGGASVQLSEAPAWGRSALLSAALAWLLAAALAVALAALAGRSMAARIARPVAALTGASDRMAAGDLGARADVNRNDELGRLSESFNEMAARIEGTIAALRRFVADAAHEIGTPLTALQADLELAERAAATADERRLVERALGQAQRLEALSAGLLQLSRLEAGDRTSTVERLDLAALARAAADAAASRAEQAGVELILDVAAGPLPVAAERAQLDTVLGNLLDNAVKFTPEGGTVTLSAARAGGSAVVTVADTGVGIPAADQAAVFSRFHRGRNTGAYPGSGLGLAIVKAAVERFGGAVSFESSPQGSTFRVELPLA